MQCACIALIGCEQELNQLDTQAGDGDCGSTLRRGASGQALQTRYSYKNVLQCQDQFSSQGMHNTIFLVFSENTETNF